MKCSGENVILRGIFHVVSCFPLHFMLYRENLNYFSYSVYNVTGRSVVLSVHIIGAIHTYSPTILAVLVQVWSIFCKYVLYDVGVKLRKFQVKQHTGWQWGSGRSGENKSVSSLNTVLCITTDTLVGLLSHPVSCLAVAASSGQSQVQAYQQGHWK